MKKIVNVRAPVALCAALIAGIAAGYAAYRTGISWLYLLAALPVCAAVFIPLAIFSRDAKRIVLFALSSVFLIVGIIYGSLVFQYLSQSSLTYGESYICGTVESLVIGDDERQITLYNLTVNGEKLEGKLLAKLSSTAGELCDEGDAVSFTAEIYGYDLITYGRVNTHITEGVRYYCTVSSGLTAESGFSFFGSVRSFVRSRLYENLDASSAGVVYAMLTGDSSAVEDGIISSFRYGGVAHIFAVSGLHIGVVYGALLGLCRILKRRGRVSQVLCLAAILLYSGICGFTVSSVRAVIMCTVGAVSRFVGAKYDMLNSLSLAVIIILLLNPLDLFSYGFRLSVSSVLGIALFNAVLRKKLSFMPLNTGEGLSVSLSAQAGSLPAMLSAFGYLSGAGLLLNFIVLPILSTLFVVLLAGILLSAIIFPLSGAIIYAAALPLEAVMSFLALGGFENALLCGIGGTLLTAVYYVFMLALSDKINKTKIQFYGLSAAALVTAVIYTFVAAYYPVNGTYIAVSAYYGGGYVLFKNGGGSVLVVTDGVSTYNAQVFLSFNGITSPDVLVILGGETCAEFIYQQDFSFDRAYIYAEYLSVDYNSFNITSAQSFTEYGIEFSYRGGYIVVAECNGVKTGICAGGYAPYGCDLLVGDIAFDESPAAEGAYCVNFSSGSGNWRVYSGGDKKFVARSGSLKTSLMY